MASIDCLKCTQGELNGLRVHFDQKERLERKHDNPHIDVSKTHLNSFYDCSGYGEMLRRQNQILAEIDAQYPPERVRKDRKTGVMFEIPVLKEISDQGLTNQFLKDAYELIGNMVGKKYMCGMTIHRDEVHEYIDTGYKKRISLEHGHALVVPYATWVGKESVRDEQGKPLRDENNKIVKKHVLRQGVNAANFLTREFLKQLQDNMQEMVWKKYGLSYQTGQDPLHMSVEDLKRESEYTATIISRAEEEAQSIVAEANRAANNVLDDALNRASRANSEASEKTVYLSELNSQIEEAQSTLNILQTKIEDEANMAKFQQVGYDDAYEIFFQRKCRSYGESYPTITYKGYDLYAKYDGAQQLLKINRDNWDSWYKAIEDKQAGKCELGYLLPEKEWRVPESLMQEMISNLRPDAKLSPRLGTFLQGVVKSIQNTKQALKNRLSRRI